MVTRSFGLGCGSLDSIQVSYQSLRVIWRSTYGRLSNVSCICMVSKKDTENPSPSLHLIQFKVSRNASEKVVFSLCASDKFFLDVLNMSN